MSSRGDSVIGPMILILGEGRRITMGDWHKVEGGRAQTSPVRGGLPRQLKEMTEEDVWRVVNYLSKKPLKDLRRWQDIVIAQLKEGTGSDDAVDNLQEMDRHLAAAVHLKEFPECSHI